MRNLVTKNIDKQNLHHFEDTELIMFDWNYFMKHKKEIKSFIDSLESGYKMIKNYIEFGLTKIYEKGKYIIIKRKGGTGNLIRGTRYLKSNPKIMKFGIGNGVKNKLKKGGIVSIIYFGMTDLAYPFFIKNEQLNIEHFVEFLTNVGVAFGGIILANVFIAGVVALGTTTIALPVVAYTVAVFVIGNVISFGLDYLIEEFEVKRKLIELSRNLEEFAKQEIKDFQNDLNKLERDINYYRTAPGMMNLMRQLSQ